MPGLLRVWARPRTPAPKPPFLPHFGDADKGFTRPSRSRTFPPRIFRRGGTWWRLAIHTHHDDLLGAVAPFAIASARSTVLVVDLDPDGLALPGERTLADLVEDGPTLTELVPQRAGIASLPNGGVDASTAEEVVAALVKGWPDLIVRTRLSARRAADGERCPSGRGWTRSCRSVCLGPHWSRIQRPPAGTGGTGTSTGRPPGRVGR